MITRPKGKDTQIHNYYINDSKERGQHRWYTRPNISTAICLYYTIRSYYSSTFHQRVYNIFTNLLTFSQFLNDDPDLWSAGLGLSFDGALLSNQPAKNDHTSISFALIGSAKKGKREKADTSSMGTQKQTVPEWLSGHQLIYQGQHENK